MADLDLGPADDRNKDWLERLKREQEYLDEVFEPQPEGAEGAGPPGFEPKPLPGKEACRKYYQEVDLGDIEAKLDLGWFGEYGVDLGDDLGLGGKVNPLDIPRFKLPKDAMNRVNEAAQVTEIGEDLGGYWQWECIDFSQPEYYDQIGDDWHVTAGVELVGNAVELSSEDWRDGVPEDTLLRTPDGCVIPVSLLDKSVNLEGSELWMEFADLARFRQDLEAKIEEAESWREGLLEEKRDIGLDDYSAKELRQLTTELRSLKRRLKHFDRWMGEPGTPLDKPMPFHRRPRLRVPSQKAMRDLSCEIMTLECLVKYFGGLEWRVDRPPTEEQARKYWERLAELRGDFDEDAAKRLMECVKKKWPDWFAPPTFEGISELEEEKGRSVQPISAEDLGTPVPGPELMPTVPTMDMGQTVKYSRRAADTPPPTSGSFISWPTSVIIGIIIGIIIGVGSLVWWPIEQQAKGEPQDTSSPAVQPVCNYDGACQPEAGERSSDCSDCWQTPTVTRRQPTPTARAAVPPPPTPTLQPTETVAPTPTPPATVTPTLAPTPTDTPQPTPEPQCSPGEWSECGGQPPEVVCEADYVSQCQADGTWGSCQWDPGRCAPSEPEPPPGEECVCGNGICESDTPCYESEFNCATDCGPPACERWLNAVDCDAAGGRWICGISECYCHCSS
jgi:hypothetical protein